MNIKLKKGFTLAEILITLTIIGILAALTIPAIIENTQKAEMTARYRKTYSMLTQVYNSLTADGNSMDIIWAGNSASVLNIFATRLNIAKRCGSAPGCWPDVNYTYLDGSLRGNINQVGYETTMLNDGTSILFWDDSGNCTHSYGTGPGPLYNPLSNSSCGNIGVDINGFNGPNQMGRDYFEFHVTKTGIFPDGGYDGDTCNLSGQGWGCGAKILKEGAMNY